MRRLRRSWTVEVGLEANWERTSLKVSTKLMRSAVLRLREGILVLTKGRLSKWPLRNSERPWIALRMPWPPVKRRLPKLRRAWGKALMSSTELGRPGRELPTWIGTLNGMPGMAPMPSMGLGTLMLLRLMSPDQSAVGTAMSEYLVPLARCSLSAVTPG